MPETMIDIFSGDAYSSVTLTGLVNANYPFVPTFLQGLGLAPAEGMLTLTAAFDEETGSIRMLSAIPRGAPPSQSDISRGATRVLPSQHFSREVEINADELLGARARGTMNPQTLQNLILQRVDGPNGLKIQWALTLEHLLLGMIDGRVLDADNTRVLYDFYNFFGVPRPDALNLPLSSTTGDSGLIKKAMQGLRRDLIRATNGLSSAGARLVVLCGDNFFDDLTTSKEYIAYLKTLAGASRQEAAEELMRTRAYGIAEVGETIWVNYRGSDDDLVGVPKDEARAFLMGVPGLFQTLYAPADTFETVGDLGLPLYLLNNPSRQSEKRAVFELQSNPLIACTRPRSLRRITKS